MRLPVSYIILFLALALFAQRTFAQAGPDLDRIKVQLDSLSKFIPGLNDTTDLDLQQVPLHTFIRTLGKIHEVNFYIDDVKDHLITNNFERESVKSIVLFICKRFNYKIEPIGTIIQFVDWAAPPPPEPITPRKVPGIEYADGKIMFDLKNDTLDAVIKKLSKLTDEKIITTPGTKGFLSGYMPLSDFETAFEGILFMNGFDLTKHENGYYIISPLAAAKTSTGEVKTRQPFESNQPDYNIMVSTDTSGQHLITMFAKDQPIEQIVTDLFNELSLPYFLYNKLDGNATVNVINEDINDLLSNLLRNTEYTYKVKENVYQIGKRDVEGLREVRILDLNYRPAAKVTALIPAKLKENVEVKEFIELNRLIISGPPERLNEIAEFILEIDRPVPMVKIEMIVVDVNQNRLLKVGLKSGLLGGGDTLSSGTSVVPGVDMTLTGSEINALLATSGVPTLANIGMLRSNFYLQLQAQEARGNLKVVTRPVLSTINGETATLTIGQTQYFLLESQISSNAAVNSYNQVSQRYEKIDINTTVSITPFVSQDNMLTLTINPVFNTPGTQINSSVPPTILTRQFQSTIRVKNGETVILGGLSQDSKSQSTSGIPILSRIPVLKWIFGTNTNNKTKSSILIYITPTIYYY